MSLAFTAAAPLGFWGCVVLPSTSWSQHPHPAPNPIIPLIRLVLEDEGARVTLCGDACPVGECVTGVVAAVRGHVLPNGDFEVTGCVYAGAPPQPPLPRCEDK